MTSRVSATWFSVAANELSEDVCVASEDGVFVVADGHGGRDCAQFAASRLPAVLREQRDFLPAGESLSAAFAATDDEYVGARDQMYAMTGAAVLAMVLDGGELHVANAGDCRAVLCRSGPSGYEPVQLSREHTTADSQQCREVAERSPDPDPIRLPPHARSGPLRVAGTQLLTRCMGDAYLKKPDLSFPPFADGVPYVTAAPEVSSARLCQRDCFVILATRGVWDMLTNTEAIACVLEAREREPAAQLRRIFLQRVCETHRVPADVLDLVPRGRARRRLHDDATALVVEFKHPPGTRPPPELEPELQRADGAPADSSVFVQL